MSDELTAGRPLDARVHEQVFGQSPYRDEQYAEDLPYYSTDLAASWQVAEHLQAQGYRVDAGNWPGGIATVTLTSPVDEPQVFAGATPAVALCRAALAVAADRKTAS
jgi:hypothetical protein